MVICARERRLLEAAEAAFSAAGTVLAVQADVSDAAGAERVVEQAMARFGAIDVLVNNVGKAGGGDIVATSDAEWQSAIDQTCSRHPHVAPCGAPHARRRRRGRADDRFDLGVVSRGGRTT